MKLKKMHKEILFLLLFSLIYVLLKEVNLNFMVENSQYFVYDLRLFSFSFVPYIFATLLFMIAKLFIPVLKELNEEGYIGIKKEELITSIISIIFVHGLFFYYLDKEIYESLLPNYQSTKHILLIYLFMCVPTSLLYFYLQKLNKYTIIQAYSGFIIAEYTTELPLLNFNFVPIEKESYLSIAIACIMLIYLIGYINIKEIRLYTKYPSKITRYKIYGNKNLFASLKYNAYIMFSTIIAENIYREIEINNSVNFSTTELDFIFMLLIFISTFILTLANTLQFNAYESLLQGNGSFIYNEKIYKSNKQYYIVKMIYYVLFTSVLNLVAYAIFYYISLQIFGSYQKSLVIVIMMITNLLFELIFNIKKHFILNDKINQK